jgi:hypothetical protein
MRIKERSSVYFNSAFPVRSHTINILKNIYFKGRRLFGVEGNG